MSCILPRDCLTEIFRYIDAGSDYKSIVFTCREWCDVMIKIYPNLAQQLTNHLATLVKMFPEKSWNWAVLTMHKQITMEFMQNTSGRWTFSYIVGNPNVTAKVAEQYLDRANYEYVQYELPHVRDIILANPDRSWLWKRVSRKIVFTLELLVAHIHLPWDWMELSRNKSITADIVEALPEQLWNYPALSSHLSLDYIFQHMNCRWSWSTIAVRISDPTMAQPAQASQRMWYSGLSNNKNLTWGHVQKNINQPWNWKRLSCRQSMVDNVSQDNLYLWDIKLISRRVAWDIIVANRNAQWHWMGVSKNKYVTWDIICANPDLPWNWRYISINPNVTATIVFANLTKQWDWYHLSFNANISLDDIIQHADLAWDWGGLTYRLRLTWQDVANNIHLPWDWKTLSRNFHFQREFVMQ